MNAAIRLALMLGLIGNFNAQAMKNFKNIDKFKTSIGKKLLQNSSKKYFSTRGFTSGLFNQKTNAIKSKNLITGKNLSSKYFDSIPKNYSTVSNIDQKTYLNNDFIKNKDRFYGQEMADILADGYKKGSFINVYKELDNNYRGTIGHWEENEATKNYDEYREKKYQELQKIVQNNENYKKEVEPYEYYESLINSKETKILTNKIEKIIEKITKNETSYTPSEKEMIPLISFEYLIASSERYKVPNPIDRVATTIAPRLILLQSSLNENKNKSVSIKDIRTNPFFDSTVFNFIEVKSHNIANFKEIFNKSCEYLKIPNTLDQYVDFLSQPFIRSNVTYLQDIFREVLMIQYLLPSKDPAKTAEAFVQFLAILERIKNDPEFRESAMEILGLDQAETKYKEFNNEAEKKYKEKVKSGGFFNTLFGKREYSTTPQGTRSYSTSRIKDNNAYIIENGRKKEIPTIKRLKEIPDNKETYPNNDFITKFDKFYGKNINEILEKALEDNELFYVFADLYFAYENLYKYAPNPEIARTNATKEMKEYDEYRIKRLNELNNAIQSNEKYKKEFEYYNNIIKLMKSNEAKELEKNIENIQNKIDKKGYSKSDVSNIPLRYFRNLLSSHFSESSNSIIAARLVDLIKSLKNIKDYKNISVENIQTNPYFVDAFNTINQQSKLAPRFKALFNEACESLTIPETAEQYVDFLAQPFSNSKITILEYIFGRSLIKKYLLPSNSGKTTEDFVKFVAILERMKNDPEFRESAMDILGLNKAEAIYNDFRTIKRLQEIPNNKKESNLSIWQTIRNYF